MPEKMLPDKRVIACNYISGTKVCAKGALAYLVMRESERVVVLARSRGGRWIRKWEGMDRLENFRWKTVPPEAPEYDRLSDWSQRWTLEQFLAVRASYHPHLATEGELP